MLFGGVNPWAQIVVGVWSGSTLGAEAPGAFACCIWPLQRGLPRFYTTNRTSIERATGAHDKSWVTVRVVFQAPR